MSNKILYLCHRVPYPPDKGDRIRSYHVLQLLRSLGQVSLGYLTDEPIPEQTADWLAEHCQEVVSAPISRWRRWLSAGLMMLRGRSATEGLFYSGRFQRAVQTLLEQTAFDTVVCFSSSTVQYVDGRGLDARTIVDLVDVDSQKWLDYAERARRPLSWLLRWEANRVRRIEKGVARAKAVVMITEPEAEIYRAFCPQATTKVVSNGVDLAYYTPAEKSPTADCVFVGYLDYRANITGLEWFCGEVWPELRRRVPDATFRIIGRNPTEAVWKLQEIPGVEVVGPVDDVREQVQRARMVVVPLLVARGVQNKILEAMAMGKPVIATPQALTGIAAEEEREILAAQTVAEWIEAVTSLRVDTDRAAGIGRAARSYVERNHRWQSCLERFGELVETSSPENENRLVQEAL